MKTIFIKIRLGVFFAMLLFSIQSLGQIKDTIYLDYQIPRIFEKIHTPGMNLVVCDNELKSEMPSDSATTWTFPNAIVSGITDCKYGIEFNYNTVELVFLKAKNDAGVRNIRNFVIDHCPDFTLTEGKKNNFSFCGNCEIEGIMCLICYTENRKHRTAFMEISGIKD